MRMSKVFEPILFDTAIEPLPCEKRGNQIKIRMKFEFEGTNIRGSDTLLENSSFKGALNIANFWDLFQPQNDPSFWIFGMF